MKTIQNMEVEFNREIEYFKKNKPNLSKLKMKNSGSPTLS